MNRLEELSAQIADQKQPPVDRWSPDISGDIDIYIDAQGRWFHEGTLITRQKLVNLFASILWFENDEYFLVTPVEKWRVRVADVPFIINQAELVDGTWVVETNTGTRTKIGQSHPVELREFAGQSIPYVRIRYNLWGRVNRSVYMQWVELALAQKDVRRDLKVVFLQSGNYRFAVAAR